VRGPRSGAPPHLPLPPRGREDGFLGVVGQPARPLFGKEVGLGLMLPRVLLVRAGGDPNVELAQTSSHAHQGSCPERIVKEPQRQTTNSGAEKKGSSARERESRPAEKCGKTPCCQHPEPRRTAPRLTNHMARAWRTLKLLRTSWKLATFS
jgi:hypothetical protein